MILPLASKRAGTVPIFAAFGSTSRVSLPAKMGLFPLMPISTWIVIRRALASDIWLATVRFQIRS